MKIVIDIPEDAYKLFKNEGVDWLGAEYILNAVANGTPLPKGHGRLIDAKDAYKKFYNRSMAKIGKEALDETPTIIEADKESEV